MIPKIIHYCWFGKGEKPEIIKHCIAGWKKYCPDYRIIEWNEDNFDVNNSCTYAKQAYDAKKWAFTADYARLKVLYEYGGVYLDTDMELFSSLDSYIQNGGVLGFESNDYVATGIIATEKNNSLIKKLMDEYNSIEFINADNTYNYTTNVQKTKKYLVELGLKCNGKTQNIGDFTVYKQSVFYPNTFLMLFGQKPQCSVTIHHATASWSASQRKNGFKKYFRAYLVNKARNLIGTDNLVKLKKG